MTQLWESQNTITLSEVFVNFLIGSSRFLILSQLLSYTDIKESCLFVAEIVETLDLDIVVRSNDLAIVFLLLDRF